MIFLIQWIRIRHGPGLINIQYSLFSIRFDHRRKENLNDITECRPVKGSACFDFTQYVFIMMHIIRFLTVYIIFPVQLAYDKYTNNIV